MARPPLRPVPEHQERVRALLPPTPVVEVPLHEAEGRALARDVVAAIALPSFANSSMDGYAVRAAEVAGASADAPVTLPVAGDVPAGATVVAPLAPGTAVRIMTGAPLPDGADAVVPVEATDRGVEQVLVHEPRDPGAHVRAVGCDVAVGDDVLGAGTRLDGPQLGLLSALGLATVPVHERVRALVVSTGSELVEHGEELAHGQIHDANSVMLAAALRAAGAEARVTRFVADDPVAFAALLDEEVGRTDLVVTSGGVSEGAYEVVKDVLAPRGVEFGKVAMQPGMPQGSGVLEGPAGRAAVVCLPGNPVSAYVSFEVFLRPALLAAAGHARTARPAVRLTLAEPLRSPAGKRQFRRGRTDLAAGTVSLAGGYESHFLGSLATADCLLDLPEDVTALEAGAEVTAWLLT